MWRCWALPAQATPTLRRLPRVEKPVVMQAASFVRLILNARRELGRRDGRDQPRSLPPSYPFARHRAVCELSARPPRVADGSDCGAARRLSPHATKAIRCSEAGIRKPAGRAEQEREQEARHDCQVRNAALATSGSDENPPELPFHRVAIIPT